MQNKYQNQMKKTTILFTCLLLFITGFTHPPFL